MTISNPTNLATLTGNGVTTSFPYTFLIPDEDSVEVTLLVIATGVEGDPLDPSLYTISGLGDPAGGEVEYPLVGSPLAATHKINIRRVVAYEQGLSLTAQSGYDPEALEDQLDLIVMQVQQVAEEVSRAVTVTAGSDLTPDELIDTIVDAAADATAAATAAQTAETNAEAAEAQAEVYRDEAEAFAAQAGTGSFVVYKWVATGGQSVFNGADATPVLSVEPAGNSSCFVSLGRLLLNADDWTRATVNFTLVGDTAEAGEIFEVKVATTDVLNTVSDSSITLAKHDAFPAETVLGNTTGGSTTPQHVPASALATMLAPYTASPPERGPTLSNSAGDLTNDIDFAAGVMWDSTFVSRATLTAKTKRLDANWAAGTAQGGRYSGAAITDTTYHCYAVWKAAGADPDFYFHPHGSTDAQVLAHLQAETGGASYLYVQRVGSILRESGAIVRFIQSGKRFKRTPVTSVSNSVIANTNAITRVLHVPVGIITDAIIGALIFCDRDNDTAFFGLLTDLASVDTAPTSTLNNIAFYNSSAATTNANMGVGIEMMVTTDIAASIRSRFHLATATTTLNITSMGWVDFALRGF